MTDIRTQTGGQKPRVAKLALSKETVQELSEGEIQVEGGGFSYWNPQHPHPCVRTRGWCNGWSQRRIGNVCIRVA